VEKHKNKFGKSGIFLALKNHHPKHHNPPSTHHKITTNYHPFSPHFPRTPFKNTSKGALSRSSTTPEKEHSNFQKKLMKL